MTSSMISQRDDEMDNINVGVSYIAPSLSDVQSVIIFLWREILGDFNIAENGYAHVNTANR